MSTLPDLDSWDIARYSRHISLAEVGIEGQRRLKGSSVLCVGTGGLGSPLLLYLAASGVGRIGIVDFDAVDESNLQRQIIHGTASIGQSKVESAKARILEINPRCRVDLYDTALTSDNALETLRPYDVVIDGTDNFPTRYLLNDACVLLDKPYVYGSIYKFEGQASVFNYKGGPNYRDLYPDPPPPGLVPSCAEGGVLGILPGVIGCIQATETIKILLGKGTSLSGRLLLYDALKMSFHELKLGKDPNAEPITSLIDYEQFCGVSKTETATEKETFERMSVSRISESLSSGWKPFVIDVRQPHEAELARLSFADILIPHDQLVDQLSKVPRDREVLVHCKTGMRSAYAASVLKQHAFERVINMEGGIVAWAAEIDTSVPHY